MRAVRFDRTRKYARASWGTQAPLVRAKLRFGVAETPEFAALVDSGADVSSFHVSMMNVLGIDPASCRIEDLGGVGGTRIAYVHPASLTVEKMTFQIEAWFVDEPDPTFALLGRADVFRQFLFGFDQRAGELLIGRY